ncbi:hypothetical protein ACGFX8_29075 [Streptomyces sp. NPDC048362]
MTREELLAILGAETVAAIHTRVAEAPEPSEELVNKLRRIGRGDTSNRSG